MNKTEIEKMKTIIEEKQKALQVYCHEQFKLGAKSLFDENSGLKSFTFKGYVPFFNDGSECTFSAQTDYVGINEIDGYDLDYPEDQHKEEKVLQAKVKELLQAFDDDFYKQLFGAHFQVVVTADKISVEEYTDHD